MSIQIAICDDTPEDIKKISEALYAYNESFQITEYSNSEFLVADCLEHENLFDILFLDIYMPTLNGIETATKIRGVLKDIIIIFISSSKEHYPEAFEIFAFNYLLKPINSEKLNHVMDQALLLMNKERRYQIQFNYKSKNYRVFCRDILYIESQDKIVLFHMVNNTTMQCYSKLDDIIKQLPEDSFIRTHQSYVVNIYHIKEMADNHFYIGSSIINISKKYQKVSKEKYFDYLFTHMHGNGR